MYFISNLEIYFTLTLCLKLVSEVLNGWLWDSKYDTVITLALAAILVVGVYNLKIRNQCIMAFVVYLIALFVDWLIGSYMIGNWICIVILSGSVFCIFRFGQFWYITPTGPYGVGFKEIVLNDSETKPTLSIFYPISREFYEAHLDDDQYVHHWLVRNEFLVGLCKGKLKI
jgi:hypothetical protein